MLVRSGTSVAVGWGALSIVLALACARSRPPESEPAGPALRGLDFEADLEFAARSPARLQATITIENRRATPATLTFPIACVGLLRAYEEDDGLRAPVWEQAPAEGCSRVPTPVELMPGEEREIVIPAISPGEVLGGDLPEGTYRFTVFLEPDGHVLEIDAGEAELERSRGRGGG